MSAFTIVQLYPEELGVAGDRGNVMALATRMRRSGFDVDIVEYRAGDPFPEAVDVVVVGSGPVSAMRNIHADLLAIRPRLEALHASGVPFFAFGSGAELLGAEIVLVDGTTMPGLGILPFRAVRTRDRRVAYIITETADGRLVGFEDHASRWELQAGAEPLGTLVVGGGNGDGATEGVVSGASVGTQVGGPVLPLNPVLTDRLLRHAAARRGLSYTPGAALATLDRYAEEARGVIVRNSEYKFTSI